MAFDESKHPRDKGKWTSGGGSTPEPGVAYANPDYIAIPGQPLPIAVTGGAFVVVDDVSHAENARRCALAAAAVASDHWNKVHGIRSNTDAEWNEFEKQAKLK
jgi:hypothetical protein